MRPLYLTILACTGLLATVAPARADFISTAVLSPATDGATTSNGSGSATVSFNAMTDDFTYTLSWMNLTGSATMAHIHYGAPGVSGPIVVPFFMTLMPASDTLTGTLTQADVTPAAGISTIAQVAQAIEAGDAYVNIHTAAYPNGELRGQLAVSPEPSTTGFMLLAGAGCLAWIVKRRRQTNYAAVPCD